MNDYREDAPRYALRPLAGTDSLPFLAVDERVRTLGLAGTALDVGCGAGRSTRFLRGLGLDAVGLDVDDSMLAEAARLDVGGTYRSCAPRSPFPFDDAAFDVVLSAWAVVEIDVFDGLEFLFGEVARVLRSNGTGFVVTNTPEFYAHEWVTSEVDFPENAAPLRSGQRVTARLLPEGVVVHDTFWSDGDYRRALAAAGLVVRAAHRPLASADADAAETTWRDETTVAPHVVYEFGRP